MKRTDLFVSRAQLMGRQAGRRATPKNLPLVWLRLTAYVNEALEDKDAVKAVCEDLNAFLDELASQDAFGTEGQNDPRGDQRR